MLLWQTITALKSHTLKINSRNTRPFLGSNLLQVLVARYVTAGVLHDEIWLTVKWNMFKEINTLSPFRFLSFWRRSQHLRSTCFPPYIDSLNFFFLNHCRPASTHPHTYSKWGYFFFYLSEVFLIVTSSLTLLWKITFCYFSPSRANTYTLLLLLF